MSPALYREVLVPEGYTGMRVDRFLARRFRRWSRSAIVRGIKQGQVVDTLGRPVRSSQLVRAGETLRIAIPGLAPTGPPPPFPAILHEDERLVVVDKPPGLLTHPAGDDFVWALIGMARARWPDRNVDLVHRLDRDTSGTLVFTKDEAANQHLKRAFKEGGCVKEYQAICRGVIPWDTRTCEGPIGPAGGEIRIQMAVRSDGLPARTDFTVLQRLDGHTRVHCRLHTGRTHQIRVHLHHLGFSILGDRMYGVEPEVFLTSLKTGPTPETLARAGAPRQLLHAWRLGFTHPDGGAFQIEAPLPDDWEP